MQNVASPQNGSNTDPLITLILGALWLTSCGALGGSGEQREWPEASPALWEVTMPLGQKGWLFGTIHSLPDDVEWRTPALETVLAQSESLIVEIADYDSGPDIFAELARTEGRLPLQDRVSGEERGIITALIERAGSDGTNWSTTETWAAALILSNAVSRGDPENGVDRALLSEETDFVENLETVRGQLSIFDTLPESEQADLLVLVGEASETEAPYATLEAWLTGDLETLEQLADANILGDPELRQALHAGRNSAWINQISHAMDRGRKPLVAVGAAHMLGEDGLIAMMERQGYTVTRIQ